MNNHRKIVLDKFYLWVESNIDWLPSDVSDITAEIWNIEEECDFWRLYASNLKRLLNNQTSINLTGNENHPESQPPS